jgi:hypothetical protein
MLLNPTNDNELRLDLYRRRLAYVVSGTRLIAPEQLQCDGGEECNYDELTAGLNEKKIGEWWLRQAQAVAVYPQRVARGHAYQIRRI